MTSEDRAKLVLELCAYELTPVDDHSRLTLRWAIQSQIDEAVKDKMREFNKTVVNKARMQETNSNKLQAQLKTRKKGPH